MRFGIDDLIIDTFSDATLYCNGKPVGGNWNFTNESSITITTEDLDETEAPIAFNTECSGTFECDLLDVETIYNYFGIPYMQDTVCTINGKENIRPKKHHIYFVEDVVNQMNINPEIIKIEVVKPNKVMNIEIGTRSGGRYVTDKCVDGGIMYHYESFFTDQKNIKVVVKEPDVFDMEKGCYIALAKYLYSDTMTFKGVEKAAEELTYYKWAEKTVRKAIQKWKADQKAIEKQERIEAENKAIAERRRAKNIAKKKKKAELEKAKKTITFNDLQNMLKNLMSADDGK